MKSYKNLWDKFISKENFDLAAKKAIKSKKSKKSVRFFLRHREEFLEKLRKSLIDGTFKTSPYKTFVIYEPKRRIIYKLPLYPDHVLHHALINVLGPIWQSFFIKDSFACIPGRGLLYASRRTMRFIKRNKYVLQCDIRKFYPSIDHGIIMDIIAHKIHDRRILKVLNEIIWSVGGQTNLPIGNLTSQWLGNVYMNELDHFIKQDLHWRDYIRYCDDFCLYGNNKQELHDAAQKIKAFVRERLKMEFSKCNLRRTSNGVTFIGYRHFRKFILLRHLTAQKLRRRIVNIIVHRDFSDRSVAQLASAYGWTRWCNSYHFRKTIQAFARKFSRKAGAFIKSNLFFDRK